MTDQTGAAEPAASEEHMAAYIAALRAHDWLSDFSEDMRAVRAGRESIRALREAQLLIDADGAIWDSIAPPSCRLHIKPATKGEST